MVSGPTAAAGGVAMSYRGKKAIRLNKEVGGNHSSSDICSVLKESNMKFNETAQKSPQQGRLREFKSKRYEKKEDTRSLPKFRDNLNRNGRKSVYSRCSSRVNCEFRVVRDNRVNQKLGEDAKDLKVTSKTSFDVIDLDASAKSSSTQLGKLKDSDKISNEFEVSLHGASRTQDSATSHVLNTRRQILVGEKRTIVPRAKLGLVGQRSTNSLSATASASNDSVAGVYSKTTDPVHVPSFNTSRSVNIGVIKCEVGIGRPSLQNLQFQSADCSSTSVAPFLNEEDTTRSEVFRQTSRPPKSVRSNQTVDTRMLTRKFGPNKSFWGNNRSSIVQQPTAGRQKASQPNKEWKPKLSQKLIVPDLDVVGQANTSSSSQNSSGTRIETSDLPENFSEVCVSIDKHVIIPHHLQVSDADRPHVTFGSFGMALDLSNNSSTGLNFFGAEHEQEIKASISINNHSSASVDDNPGGRDVVINEDHNSRPGSESLGSENFVESNQLNSSSSSPSNLNVGLEMAIVRSSSVANGPLDLQQEEICNPLPNFSEFDSRISHGMPYHRPARDYNLHHGLASSQEALGLHHTNDGPASFANLVQQQPSVSQSYPQVQISHFPNFFPYRQAYHQVYVQSMGVPNNPAYHPHSSCNNYLLVPGGGYPPSSSSLKYASSQFKGAPEASPTCYGNFTSPAGYSFCSFGNMCPTGLADVSRIKYMDGNMIAPNPQAVTSNIWIQTARELPDVQSSLPLKRAVTSNIWIQTARELPDVQSSLYHNMSGQAPHPAYLPSAAVSSYVTPTAQAQSQSTHFTYPGFYHQPQPSTMPNCHSVVHSQMQAMGCNVVGSQVGAYQPPPPNWTTNF